jgi:GT2 family glycosyltransferase
VRLAIACNPNSAPPDGMALTSPTFCVAIPTYLREEVLVATLRQVLEQEPSPDEVLVVDQTPKHDRATEDFLTANQLNGNLRWLRQAHPSVTQAQNRALQEARSDVIIFIDDDVILPSGFFEMHLRHYRCRNADVTSGPISGRNDVQHTPASQGAGGNPWVVALLGAQYPPNCLFGVPRIYGCNCSIRRSAALRVGGYDEHFEASALFQETDFAFRLFEVSDRFVYDPEAWLKHLKVPYGGCRIPGSNSWTERQKTLSVWLFFLRHVVGQGLPLRITLLMARIILRVGPLRRENVLRPWRQPIAWYALLASFCEARRRCASGVKSRILHPLESQQRS